MVVLQMEMEPRPVNNQTEVDESIRVNYETMQLNGRKEVMEKNQCRKKVGRKDVCTKKLEVKKL